MNQNKQSFHASIDPIVFYVAVGISALFVAWGVISPSSLKTIGSAALQFCIDNFGWVYVLAAVFFVGLMLWLAFSRFGKIRLGADDEVPEFSTRSWIAMMFSAGMGIGLMFYGVAEPMYHFAAPPFGLAEAGTTDAAKVALRYTIFHWSLQPWAIYAMFGLAMAYFTFRKGGSNLVSETFRPLIGDRVDGHAGRVIEVLAILATLFGSATSLGLGALQINSGLGYLWGLDNSSTFQVIIIAVITVAFICSAVSGVGNGIQWLSNINMILAIVLVLFLFFAGPTVYILESMVTTVGNFFSHYLTMSFRTGAYSDSDWLSGWTIFYWAWWISWAPFVGTFLARISRGRTVREFVLGVLLAPSAICLGWFAILGGTALYQQIHGGADIAAAVQQSQAAGLFATLDSLPWAGITSFLSVILIALFFVSGADAASVVMGMLTSRGDMEPKRLNVIVWGVLTGAAAGVLLIAGGLKGLQTWAILSAAPFVIVLICMSISLTKSLRREHVPAAGLYPVRKPIGWTVRTATTVSPEQPDIGADNK
ncbi:MAG TPA: BCCT family transporter [Oleiagrimonas sp.]|nr:BCCT family transporter [Oleiagrimonas sp.]